MTPSNKPGWIPTPDDCAEALRKAQALELGLPEDATMEEIGIKRLDLLRAQAARDRKLPEHASWKEIWDYDDGMLSGKHNGDALRRASAKRLGLPDTATWEEIDRVSKRNKARLLAEQSPFPPGCIVCSR